MVRRNIELINIAYIHVYIINRCSITRARSDSAVACENPVLAGHSLCKTQC
jgi:hypothetical protein